jgi:hypothetical protein
LADHVPPGALPADDFPLVWANSRNLFSLNGMDLVIPADWDG